MGDNLFFTGTFLILVTVLIVTLSSIAIELVRFNKYAEESVVQKWGVLLEGQAALANSFFERVEKEFKKRGLPYKLSEVKIRPKLKWQAVDKYLTCRMNEDFSCYIGYSAIGSNLHVNWLIQDHSEHRIHKVPIIGPLLKKHTFAMTNRVIAFATETHDAVVRVTEDIMDEQSLDKSTLNRKSSGKLGPL